MKRPHMNYEWMSVKLATLHLVAHWRMLGLFVLLTV